MKDHLGDVGVSGKLILKHNLRNKVSKYGQYEIC
jgi:hypothetical protein